MTIQTTIQDLLPNREAIRQHLQFLFGDVVEYGDGKVEIAIINKTNGKVYSGWFDADDQALDKAADYAFEQNLIEGNNVYNGAALRDPLTLPTGRGVDDDFYALTAVYVDLDDKAAVDKAASRWADNMPTMIVATGQHPHPRLQGFWKLAEPITDPDEARATLQGLARRLDGDTTVTNPSRIMRLAGSIAWPAKQGRVTELTQIVPINNPPKAAYTVEQIHRWAPALPWGEVSVQHSVRTTDVQRGTGMLGMPTGDVEDGREKYMRDTIMVFFVELVGTTGSIPTAQELFDAAWPQYEQHVNLDRPGRGPDEFRQKCQYIINRFYAGRLPRLKTEDDVVAAYQAKQKAEKKSHENTVPTISVKEIVQATADKPDDQFETLTPDQVMALPTPEWLIKDILPQTGLVFVYGAPKSGKSFVVLDMAMRVVNGQPWFGRTTKQGGVLYIAGEGAGGYKNRYKAWHQHNNTAPNAGLRLKPTAIDLGDDEDLVKLLNTVRAQIQDAKLVIVDTLARATPGIDENDAASMGKVVQVCDLIWRELNVCVLLVHHSGKDEGRGMRGSSALLGAADAVLQVRRDKDEDGHALPEGRIRIDAMKDAEMGDDIYFKLEQVEWADGLQSESSMVVVEGAEKAEPKDGWPSKDTCRDILRAISAAWEAGKPWSSQYQSRRNGMFASDLIKTQWSVPYKVADDMILTWLQNGVLTVEMYDARNNKSGLKKVGDID